MYGFLNALHVVVSLLMVGAILLQAGKGAEIGAAFGGSSQTIFGGRGPGTFLSKMTALMAAIFFMTALSLSVQSKGRFLSTSVLDLEKEASPVSEAASEALPKDREAPPSKETSEDGPQ